jgi:NitT/TauT family transport system substrate-binding protein
VRASRVRSLVASLLALALAAPAAGAEPVKVQIGYIPILAASPLLIIDAEHWAQAEGLDLKLVRFDSGPAAIQALAAGKIDVMYGGVAAVVMARASGVPVSVIANSAVEELAVVARGPLAQLARGRSAKDAVDAFVAEKGRKVKIATQPAGSVPDTILKHWLQKMAQIDPAKVEILGMGIDKTEQALLAGAVDAATIREPAITIVRSRDPQAAVLAAGSEMFPDQPGTVVAARSAFLKHHAEAATKLVALHLRADRIIAEDKARASAAAQEYLGKGLIEPAITEKAMASPSSKFLADPHAVVGAVDRLQSFEKELGVVSETVPMSAVFDFTFYDAARTSQAAQR